MSSAVEGGCRLESSSRTQPSVCSCCQHVCACWHDAHTPSAYRGLRCCSPLFVCAEWWECEAGTHRFPSFWHDALCFMLATAPGAVGSDPRYDRSGALLVYLCCAVVAGQSTAPLRVTCRCTVQCMHCSTWLGCCVAAVGCLHKGCEGGLLKLHAVLLVLQHSVPAGVLQGF